MIGDVVRKTETSEKPKISTRLRDFVLDSWTEERQVIAPTLVKQDETWKEFWLYASGTKQWCPRMCAIRALFPVVGEKIKAEALWNMGQGKAYHRLFQDDIWRSLGGKFLGCWGRYMKCEDMHLYRRNSVTWDEPDFGDDEYRSVENIWVEEPRVDGDSFKNRWEYIEPKIRMYDYRVVAKLDGIISWDDGLEIQELKSEKSIARDDLDPMIGGAARKDHVEQVQLGMWASGIHRSRITYMFKGEPLLRNSLMEHEIPYDEEIVSRLKGVAKQCVEAVDACDKVKTEGVFEESEDAFAWVEEKFERLPECPMKSKGKARYCSARDFCFPKGYRKKKK